MNYENHSFYLYTGVPLSARYHSTKTTSSLTSWALTLHGRYIVSPISASIFTIGTKREKRKMREKEKTINMVKIYNRKLGFFSICKSIQHHQSYRWFGVESFKISNMNTYVQMNTNMVKINWHTNMKKFKFKWMFSTVT